MVCRVSNICRIKIIIIIINQKAAEVNGVKPSKVLATSEKW